MGCVYQIINLVNNKSYVGMTTKTAEQRFTTHKYKTTALNYPLHRAIKKYGPEKFSVSTLYCSTEVKELLNAERLLIADLSPEHNLTAGGEGVFGLKHSEKSKGLMSEKHKGKPGPNLGKKFSVESRAKMSASQKAKVYKSDVGPMLAASPNKAKPVICTTTGHYFNSGLAASKAYGLGVSSVWKVVTEERKQVYGLEFKYA